MGKIKNKSTRRKTKIVGVREYIDRETQEIVRCQVVEIEERDANFKKLWIGHLLDAVDELGSKKLQLLMWLFDQADAYNRIIATIDNIKEKTGISHFTIKATLKALEEKDIIKRQTGVITLNPDVIFKGGTNARFDVLLSYRNINKKENND